MPRSAKKPAPPARSLRVRDHVLARARQRPQATVLPFAPAQHPPNVGPSASKGKVTLAQDSDLGASNEWAASAFASAFAEGQAFLGYPLLAELAQRPEYRRAVEIIALHMTRRWIKFQAVGEATEDAEPGAKKKKPATDATKPKKKKGADKAKADKIKKIEAFLEKINAQAAFRRIAEQDGFFGRAHLFLDFGDIEEKNELKLNWGDGSDAASAAKCSPQKPLKALRTVEAVWCYPTNYDASNPLSPSWYRPQVWYAMGTQLHATRLLPFIGREVSDLLKPAYSFGGLALTQMMRPYVDNWLRTRQSVADIISAFSVFVLKTKLAEALNANQGDDLYTRVDLFNLIRDNRGLMVVDKDDEDFENVAVPLGTLDVLQAQTQEHMSSVTGIPLVEFLGIQPAGLNASSEGELKVFREWIHASQERFFRPHLTTVIAFAQLSLFGKVDPDIKYEFVQLEDLSAKEIAEVEKIRAEIDAQLVEAAILDREEARQRLADDEDSPYYGIDVEDLPDLPEIDIAGAGGGGGDKPGESGDSPPAPKPAKAKVPKVGGAEDADDVEIVSIKELDPGSGTWYVCYDDKVPGDSRGYRKDQALAAARRAVDNEHEYAKRDNRQPTLIFRPR